jgi:hypothetical protein
VTVIMRARLLSLGVCFFAVCFLFAAAEEKVAFGLRHTVITNAVFGADDLPLVVTNTAICDAYGTNDCDPDSVFGVSIHLGSADKGVFVAPYCPAPGNESMEGISFGTVGGVVDSLIGSVKGTRVEWASYRIHMDFSAIGATSYTYRVYLRDLQTFEETNAGPDSLCYTGSYGPSSPRINPLLLEDGRVGVVVDFRGDITDFYIPGYHAYASRLVILADNPTNTVEDVSRIDVLGYDGLTQFSMEAEQLGKFGLYHQAIGGVSLHATPVQLTVSNIVSADFDGMVTELPRVSRYEALLMPYVLTNQIFIWSFSASGITSASPWPRYLGEARFTRLDDGTILTGNTTGAVLRVYNHGAFVGTAPSDNHTVLGTVLDTNIVLVSYFAAATQTNEPAHFGFRLADAVTLSNANGTILIGDEFHIAQDATSDPVSVLTSFSLVGEGLGGVTITNMQIVSKPPPPLRMRISGSGSTRKISWPFTQNHYLYGKTNLNSPSWNFVSGSSTYTNFESHHIESITNAARFFRLQHIYEGFFVTPYPSPEN